MNIYDLKISRADDDQMRDMLRRRMNEPELSRDAAILHKWVTDHLPSGGGTVRLTGPQVCDVQFIVQRAADSTSDWSLKDDLRGWLFRVTPEVADEDLDAWEPRW